MDRRRVFKPRHYARQAPAIDLLYFPEQINHRVQIVHAGRGHRSSRRFPRIGAPVIGRHCEPGRRGLRAFAMAERSETPVGDPRFQLDHRRMKPSWEGDAQQDSGPRHAIERRFGARHIERKRLFHQNMLARRRGPLNLCAVLTVRRRKHDRVDRRVGEDLAKVVFQRDSVRGAELFGGGAGPRTTGRETDCTAFALDGIDERPAPAADAHNGGPDHFLAASMSRTPRRAR